MKVLVFTVKGEYARFRCPFTTTSALSFSVIHPIAIKGLIGAILGVSYEELYEFTKDFKIGIQNINPIHKDTQGFNLIAQSNGNGTANFQSRVEFLRNVYYRIFLCTEENIIEQLKNVIKSKKYVFIPYLGCSEHIAKIEYEGTFHGKLVSLQSADTLIPKEFFSDKTESDVILYTDRIPVQNKKDREYSAYEKIIFSSNIRLQCNDLPGYKVGEYNVFLF